MSFEVRTESPIAEVPSSLRLGTPVRLADARIHGVPAGPVPAG
jgi:hypothetical protein